MYVYAIAASCWKSLMQTDAHRPGPVGALSGPPGPVVAGVVVAGGDAVVEPGPVPGKHDVWGLNVAPGLAGDGSENVVGGGSENVGDGELGVAGLEAVELVDRLDVVLDVVTAGIAVFTADGVEPPTAGMALVAAPPSPLVVGVGDVDGSGPVVTTIQGAGVGRLGVTIGPCVCAWPGALTAMAEHAAIMIARLTAAVGFISCSPAYEEHAVVVPPHHWRSSTVR